LFTPCFSDNLDKEITIEEWDYERAKHYEIVSALHEGRIKIICSKCRGHMELRPHLDTSNPRLLKQKVACTNGHSDYILT
jgi:hypothetical protein